MSEDIYEQKIREGLKALSALYGPDAIIPVTVKAVNTTDFTCDCQSDDQADILAVLYKNFSDGNIDLVMQPAVNSRVWIGRISDSDEWIMLKPGTLDKVIIKVGGLQFEMSGSTIKLNGGTNHGLLLLTPTLAAINELQASVNSLKSILSSWVPVSGDGGAALKTLAASWAGTTLATTAQGDVENTTVKQ